MKAGAVLATLLGVLLALWLVHASGVAAIATAVKGAGWAIVPVVAFHLTQLGASALAWRAIAPTRVRVSTFLLLRAIREGVNNLLPSAQIGGELVAVRLLR